MMKQITSKDNQTFKHVKQLKTKKYREKYQQYVIDGLRIVKHALDQKALDYVLVTETFSQSRQFLEADIEGPIYLIHDKMMKDLVETDHPQGIIGVVKRQVQDVLTDNILVLDRIQDPGNMGTLIRTADAAGFDTVVLVKGSTDPYSQKALRSSMGSIMNVNIQVCEDILSFLGGLQKQAYKVYSAAFENSIPFRDINYPDKKVLVIGNEANGISQDILARTDQVISIPMKGHVESLNAGIAGGILMFELNQ